MAESKSFRLYVPLQTREGEWLNAPEDGRLTVLGQPGRIIVIPAFTAPPGKVRMPTAIRQALLFDPLPEAEARRLLADLVTRMSVLSFHESVTFEIPHQWVEIKEIHGSHNLGQPALILAHFEPIPMGGVAFTSSSREASHFLETKLSQCPVITDERILTAIDLANGSRHDTLERSKFLAWLTILDSLAIGRKRPEKICEWLDEKIAEAECLKDENLKSGLGSLKWESRKAAIKNLIGRAGQALGEENEKIEERKTLVVSLYDVRSKLSHAGSNPIGHEHLSQAWDLARWLLAAVILFPRVLDEE
jgi:hypothetical protein